MFKSQNPTKIEKKLLLLSYRTLFCSPSIFLSVYFCSETSFFRANFFLKSKMTKFVSRRKNHRFDSLCGLADNILRRIIFRISTDWVIYKCKSEVYLSFVHIPIYQRLKRTQTKTSWRKIICRQYPVINH